MKTNLKRLRKNTILKFLGSLNFALFLFFACCLDSRTWIPFIACCATGGYLILFAYANNWFEKPVKKIRKEGKEL